jgi:hypothetical protein
MSASIRRTLTGVSCVSGVVEDAMSGECHDEESEDDMIQQLELFSAPTDMPFTPTIGVVFEHTMTLAGDTVNREELARFAQWLKDRRECCDWRVKPAYFYRILDTRIEGDHVVATCRIVENPLGVQTANPTEDEEDC